MIISNHPSYKEDFSCCDALYKDGKWIHVDKYTIIPYYLYFDGKYYFISNDIRLLRNISGSHFSIHGLIQMALYQANMYPYSLYEGIITLPLNSRITFEDGRCIIERKEPVVHKHLSQEQAVEELDRIFKKDLEKIGDRPYLMYSGGVDSSILFYYMKDSNPVSGTSIFSITDKTDHARGMEFFNTIGDFEQNIIKLDPERYLNTVRDYSYYIPFLCPGVVDDYYHCIDSVKMGCSSIVNGLGSDEMLVSHLFMENRDFSDPDYFIEKYSMFKSNIMNLLFERKDIVETVKNTMDWFPLTTIRGKIDWMMEIRQVGMQMPLIYNNSMLLGNIPRYQPYSTRDFHDFVLSLPEKLISINRVAEYILRYWAKDFLPVNLWAKEKHPFEVDFSKVAYNDLEKTKEVFFENFDNICSSFKHTSIKHFKDDFEDHSGREMINLILFSQMINNFRNF